MKLKRYKLGDVAKVEISGVDKKTKDGEVPVKLCNFTDVYYNWSITKDMEDSFMVASANANEIRRFKLKKGQVAFTKDSETRYDIGIPTYIADDFDDVILGYHCALITPDENKVSGDYINAFMHTSLIKDYFANNASGSGQRYSLSVDAMENMPLFLPSIDEQKRIASLLSNLDRKIALNRQINANLEALARQLYDYWFVQFDFSDANGKPYKSSGGKMVYNPQLKREIPEGWAVAKMSVIIEIKSGFPFQSSTYLPVGKYRIITIKNVQEGYIDQADTDFIDVLPNRIPEYCILKKGDTLMSLTGNVGRVGRVYGEHLLLNQRVGFVDCKNSCDNWAYLLISSKPIRKIVEKLGIGSAQSNVSPIQIGNISIELPPSDVISKFERIVESTLEQILCNNQEILSLTRQRDELLPLLMNGQVTVE